MAACCAISIAMVVVVVPLCQSSRTDNFRLGGLVVYIYTTSNRQLRKLEFENKQRLGIEKAAVIATPLDRLLDSNQVCLSPRPRERELDLKVVECSKQVVLASATM